MQKKIKKYQMAECYGVVKKKFRTTSYSVYKAIIISLYSSNITRHK